MGIIGKVQNPRKYPTWFTTHGEGGRALARLGTAWVHASAGFGLWGGEINTYNTVPISRLVLNLG
jgi:hypothetical protein